MLGAVAGLQQRTLRRVTAERTERSARQGLWTARQAAYAVCTAGSSARKRLCARCWQAATLERALAGELRASQAREGRARGPRYFNGAGRALQPRRWVRGRMCNPRRQSATTLTALTGASLAFSAPCCSAPVTGVHERALSHSDARTRSKAAPSSSCCVPRS